MSEFSKEPNVNDVPDPDWLISSEDENTSQGLEAKLMTLLQISHKPSQIDTQQAELLLEQIDQARRKEGERTFYKTLENFAKKFTVRE